MSEPGLDVLVRRLERVERENRWLKRAGMTVLAAGAALLLMGQALPKSRTVEAEQFIVRDGSGAVLGELGATSKDRSPVLVFNGPGGLPRITLGIIDGQPELLLQGKDGRNGLQVILENEEQPVVGLYRAGKAVAQLGVGPHGGIGLLLRESAGTRRVDLVIAPDGVSGLRMGDSAGKPRANFGLASDGSPALQLFDRDEHVRAVLGHVPLTDSVSGKVEERPASSLVLLDKGSKVIWKAP